jgi:hypothetical protein
MSYMQLLNPKGFAQEKEKEKQRDKVKPGMSLPTSFRSQQRSLAICTGFGED